MKEDEYQAEVLRLLKEMSKKLDEVNGNLVWIAGK